MGYDPELAQSALRFTLPAPLADADIARIVEVLRAEDARRGTLKVINENLH